MLPPIPTVNKLLFGKPTLMTYAPSQVSVAVAGILTLEGFVDGTFINITKAGKPYEDTKAMDGEVARIYRKDDRYTVELTLAQSSMSNNLLSALYNIDTATQLGKFPLLIRDGSGTTTFFALTAWIQDIPQVTFSNDMESRTWVIVCSDASLNIGGNDSAFSLENILSQGAAILPLLKQFGVL